MSDRCRLSNRVSVTISCSRASLLIRWRLNISVRTSRDIRIVIRVVVRVRCTLSGVIIRMPMPLCSQSYAE